MGKLTFVIWKRSVFIVLKNINNQFPQSNLFKEYSGFAYFSLFVENIEFKVRKITYIQVTTIL